MQSQVELADLRKAINAKLEQLITIKSTKDILYDSSSIETFKMGNNRLETYPSFEMTQIDIDTTDTFIQLYLNQNQIKKIKYFSFIFGKLK